MTKMKTIDVFVNVRLLALAPQNKKTIEIEISFIRPNDAHLILQELNDELQSLGIVGGGRIGVQGGGVGQGEAV